MLTRRHLLVCTAMTGLLIAAGPRAWAQGAPNAAPSPGEATAFVVKLGSDLVAIVNGPGTYEDKKSRLQPLIESAVDVDGIARFCLGRFVRSASPSELSEYTRLFHDVLINNITGKIGQFQGVGFKPTTTSQRDGEDLVGTLISRPNQEPNNLQWVVETVGGKPKVVDVIAEGTSLRLTQRADYAAYLTRNNNSVTALIAAMKQQIGR